MKRLPYLTGILFLAICLLSCSEDDGSGRQTARGIADDVQAQRDLAAEFDAALNSGDVEGVMAQYSDGAVRLPPGANSIEGKAAIRTSMQSFLDQYEAAHELRVLDVRLSGDLAVSRGSWKSTDRPKDGGAAMQEIGAWTTVRERQADGSWKTILEIWNRDGESSQ